METIVTAWQDQQDELRDLLAPVTTAEWAAPSRCEGWDVADVLLHLAQTNEMAAASLADRFADQLVTMTAGLRPSNDVDDGAAAMVEHERGAPGAAVFERWARGVADFGARLASQDPRRRVTWVAGQLSVQTLVTTRLAETWIHTGDIAAALGVAVAPSDRLRHVARLAWRTLPYAFARAGRTLTGPVAFHLTGPHGDAWTFEPDGAAATTITGDGVQLCLVAGRRVAPESTSLRAAGPDGDAVLELVRTYA